jgi:hypothetical protein
LLLGPCLLTAVYPRLFLSVILVQPTHPLLLLLLLLLYPNRLGSRFGK